MLFFTIELLEEVFRIS